MRHDHKLAPAVAAQAHIYLKKFHGSLESNSFGSVRQEILSGELYKKFRRNPYAYRQASTSFLASPFSQNVGCQ